eukprot:UN00391
MGLVYSALAAAAPENPLIGYALTPVNYGITAWNMLIHYPWKIFSSEPVQGAIADTLMVYDFYMKYAFPYIILGSLGLAYLGIPDFERSKEMTAFQTRAQIDAIVQQQPKHQARWAELWGLK